MASLTMRAARLHEPGGRMTIETIDIPAIREDEVLVRVQACGVVPNMLRVFSPANLQRLPPLPATLGLDAAGVVAEVGDAVIDVRPGERVYINPLLSCGTCQACRARQPQYCPASALRGYFAFRPEGFALLRRHPHGGFAEYTAIPARHIVKLPPEVSFAEAARFGYLGTAYAGLKAGGVTGGSWVLINGVTGTLGVGAVIWALALGATRILGLGRNRDILDRLRQLAPPRIETLAIDDTPVEDWVRARTDGLGADMLLDCTARGSPVAITQAAMAALKPGGITITVGALTGPLPIAPLHFMNHEYGYRGSNWFTEAQGAEMAEMLRAGVADLGCLEHRAFPLDQVNEALDAIGARPGGMTNIVVEPWA